MNRKNKTFTYAGETMFIGEPTLSVDPRCFTFAAVAIGAIGIGASIYAAKTQADAQKSAARKNASAQKNTNVQNALLNYLSRGGSLTPEIAGMLGLPESAGTGYGSAVLPNYFGPVEREAGRNAGELYTAINSLYGTPDQEMEMYRRLASKYGPAMFQNQQLASDLASGQLTEQELAEAQPVARQRLAGAEANRNASLEALQQTLNEIDSIQAGKGYSGDTVGSRMLRFEGRRRIGLGSANDLQQALMANALEKQQIQSGGRALRLSNINLPTSMAQSDINFAQLPAAGAVQRQGLSLQPFNFFKIGSAVTPYQTPPQLQPVASNGQLVAQGIGTAANATSDYFLQQQRRKQALQDYQTLWAGMNGSNAGNGIDYDPESGSFGGYG